MKTNVLKSIYFILKIMPMYLATIIIYNGTFYHFFVLLDSLFLLLRFSSSQYLGLIVTKMFSVINLILKLNLALKHCSVLLCMYFTHKNKSNSERMFFSYLITAKVWTTYFRINLQLSKNSIWSVKFMKPCFSMYDTVPAGIRFLEKKMSLLNN